MVSRSSSSLDMAKSIPAPQPDSICAIRYLEDSVLEIDYTYNAQGSAKE